jgi:hypothetical protein
MQINQTFGEYHSENKLRTKSIDGGLYPKKLDIILYDKT